MLAINIKNKHLTINIAIYDFFLHKKATSNEWNGLFKIVVKKSRKKPVKYFYLTGLPTCNKNSFLISQHAINLLNNF